MIGEQQYPPQFQQSPRRQQVEEFDQPEGDSQGRLKYLRKLYFFVFIHLAFIAWLTCTAAFGEKFAKWLIEYRGFSFWFCLIIVLLIALVTFFSRQNVSNVPNNWVAYVLFTVFFGFLLAYWQAQRREEDAYIYYGVFTLLIVVLSLFIHVFFSKQEITFQSVSLYVFAAAFWITFFFEIKVTSMPLLHTFLFGIMAIIFGFYFAWDNETVINEAKSSRWKDEDPISGAVAIYLNVFKLLLGLADLIRQLIIKARQ